VLLWLAELARDSPLGEEFRLVCSYLFSALADLDVRQVAHTLEGSKELKQQAMTIAEKLMAEGRAEGEARGALRVLQKLMGMPPSSEDELAAISVAEIQARFENLEREYAALYRARG